MSRQRAAWLPQLAAGRPKRGRSGSRQGPTGLRLMPSSGRLRPDVAGLAGRSGLLGAIVCDGDTGMQKRRPIGRRFWLPLAERFWGRKTGSAMHEVSTMLYGRNLMHFGTAFRPKSGPSLAPGKRAKQVARFLPYAIRNLPNLCEHESLFRQRRHLA